MKIKQLSNIDWVKQTRALHIIARSKTSRHEIKTIHIASKKGRILKGTHSVNLLGDDISEYAINYHVNDNEIAAISSNHNRGKNTLDGPHGIKELKTLVESGLYTLSIKILNEDLRHTIDGGYWDASETFKNVDVSIHTTEIDGVEILTASIKISGPSQP